ELGLDLRPIFAHFLPYTTPVQLERWAFESLGRKVRVDPGKRQRGRGDNNLDRWQPWYDGAKTPRPFGDGATYEKAGAFLGDPGVCGWVRRGGAGRRGAGAGRPGGGQAGERENLLLRVAPGLVSAGLFPRRCPAM